MDRPKRRLTREEYIQQVNRLRDIAAATQDAVRLCLCLWDVPDCIHTVIDAFRSLDRLLFPEGMAWEKTLSDLAELNAESWFQALKKSQRQGLIEDTKKRRRPHRITAEAFWLKPCAPDEKTDVPESETPYKFAGWNRLIYTHLALLNHYDRVLADHGWGELIANRKYGDETPVPEQLSPSFTRLAETADLLADLSWRGVVGPDCIISLGNLSYRVGESDPVTVTEREDAVLRAFLLRPSLTKPEIQCAMGLASEDALTVLRHLKGTEARAPKYKGLFAPCIRMPGRKGAGGYHVRIRQE